MLKFKQEGGPGPPTGPQTFSLNPSAAPLFSSKPASESPLICQHPLPCSAHPVLALAKAELRSHSLHHVNEHQRDQLHLFQYLHGGYWQFQLQFWVILLSKCFPSSWDRARNKNGHQRFLDPMGASPGRNNLTSSLSCSVLEDIPHSAFFGTSLQLAFQVYHTAKGQLCSCFHAQCFKMLI